MPKLVTEMIEHFQTLKGERAPLNQLWDELAEVLAPNRTGFSKTISSVHRNSKIFDTQPITAKRGLVNAIGSMLRPKSSAPGKWFDIVPEDEELLEGKEVKDWVDFAEERLWRALYNPKARFIEVTGEVDDDLVTFGTGIGFVGLNKDQNGFMFRAFHLARSFVMTDENNEPNGVFIAEHLTAAQAAERWGESNIGKKTREVLTGANKDTAKKFMFLWCVKKRYAFDPSMKNNKNMPIGSYVIDVDSEHMVLEEGYEEFPFFIPRWDTRSLERYGRGPGIMALPSVLSLNQMGKTMLRGLHRAVDPPWLLPSDSMVNAPQMRPGGVSYYDAKAIRNLGMSNPFQQMDSKANIPWGLNAQQAEREQIHALFYKNVLNLPVDSPAMTATEVIERRNQFIREIGAVFGGLESNYTSPVVERCFNIMMRQGAFGDISSIPEALQGANIGFRFASPVEKAKRQIEETTVSENLQKVLAIGQIRPEIMDRFNWDEIGKFIAESGDFPSDLTHDDQTLAEIKEQNAMAAQAEQQMQMVERGAAVAGQLPEQMVTGEEG